MTTNAIPLACVLLACSTTISVACSRPYTPSIPSGYYAEDYQMERAQREVRDYASQVDDYLRCLQGEIDDLQDEIEDHQSSATSVQSEAQSLLNDWNRSVQQYNNR